MTDVFENLPTSSEVPAYMLEPSMMTLDHETSQWIPVEGTEEERDQYRVTYVGNYCNLFEPTVFYPPRTVYARLSPTTKKERRKQELNAKTLVFDPRCFKLRFGVVFVTELYAGGVQGFKVRVLKSGRKGTSYSLTIKVINNKLFWYTSKPGDGVRSFITPVPSLFNWLRKSMLLVSDDRCELQRLSDTVTFQMFKLASIAMPWVAEKVEKERESKMSEPIWTYDFASNEYHRLVGWYETALWLGMVYPNLPVHEGVFNSLVSLPRIAPEFRGGAKEICKRLCGVSSKRAIELLEHGILLAYPCLKAYVTTQQFLAVEWESMALTHLPSAKKNVSYLFAARDKGLRNAIGRMFCADLKRKDLSSSFSMLRDIVHSVEQLERKGFTADNFKKLRKNFKSLTLFDQALGHCVGLVQKDFYEYQHTFKGLIRGVGEVRMPKTSHELMQWGQDLGNCIGGYVGYFSRGHSLLLGLVSHKGECLAAAELCANEAKYMPVNANILVRGDNGYVYFSQCVGYHNYSTADSVYLKEFIDNMAHEGHLTTWGLDTFEFGVGPCREKTESKHLVNDAIVNKVIITIKGRRHGQVNSDTQRVQYDGLRVPQGN